MDDVARMCKKNGLSLEFVPDNDKTVEMCQDACRQNGMALQFVPESFLSVELCCLSCTFNGLAIQFVPMEYISELTCYVACRNNYRAIEFVPEIVRNNRIVDVSMEQNEDFSKKYSEVGANRKIFGYFWLKHN